MKPQPLPPLPPPFDGPRDGLHCRCGAIAVRQYAGEKCCADCYRKDKLYFDSRVAEHKMGAATVKSRLKKLGIGARHDGFSGFERVVGVEHVLHLDL